MTAPELTGTTTPQRYVQVDEEGYFSMEGLRVADAAAGLDWMSKMTMDDRGRAWTSMDGTQVMVEAFDEPFVALDIEIQEGSTWRG